MPQTTGQSPLYYNHLPTGRPVAEGTKTFRKYASNYLDVRNDPLYPFGYGLSYTTFEYGEPRLQTSALDSQSSSSSSLATVTVSVKNTGSMDADEVVQLYIRDLVARISRPVKELKAFERIHLKAGESRDVTFTVTRDMLKYFDGNGNEVVESGDFLLMMGPDSRNLKTVTYTLK